ncbi:unnamed protein product [Rhizophagus irregularis]|nr:unnamed protein product [Rhizophagus irregularis]
MSFPTLQQFEERSEHILRNASRLLEIGEDINELELQVEHLSLLLSMYTRVEQYYDNATLQRKLNEINFLKTGGRPKIEFNEDVIKLLRNQGFSWTNIATTFGISSRTLNRRRKENNIRDTAQHYSSITNDEIDTLVNQIKFNNPFFGQNMIMGAIRSRGIKITRKALRESIQRVDAIGAVTRWTQVIPRRKYRVAGPNAIWHIDGNHKLIRWKMVIHAGIDGYSRVIPFIYCSGNNKSSTVFTHFKEGCDIFGTPSRVRADRGGENVLVKKFMNEYRGEGRGSFIEGRSVHNQRIERLWVDLVKSVIKKYSSIFMYLEDRCGLNINNNVYLFCLHFVFLPRINENLKQWRVSWNNHKLRTEKHQTPIQLYTKGMIESGFRGMEDEVVDPNDYGIDWEGPTSQDNDNTVIVDDPRNVLTNQEVKNITS